MYEILSGSLYSRATFKTKKEGGGRRKRGIGRRIRTSSLNSLGVGLQGGLGFKTKKR